MNIPKKFIIILELCFIWKDYFCAFSNDGNGIDKKYFYL